MKYEERRKASRLPPPIKEGKNMSTINKGKTAFDSFGYGFINGKECYGKFVYDKESESVNLVKYGRYIAIEKVCKDLDGGAPVLTIAYDTLDDERLTVDVEKTLLGKKRDLQTILLKNDADVYDSSLSVLMSCLHKSEEQACRGMCFHRTGWLIGQANTKDETLCFKGNTLIESDSAPDVIKYVGQYDLASKGSFSEWVKMIKKQVLGNIPLEIAVLIGLSPIISSEWGARNLLFHFMGDSGAGKTTSAILCVSTTGCPNPAETARLIASDGKPLRSLMSSWKSTANALTGKVDGLDGTIMVLDELSKAESSEMLASAIYVFSDGDDKDRMNGEGGLQRTNVIRTNILSVGEESLIEKARNKNSGVNVRVCEISTQFTKSAEQAEAIVEVCYANYGHAATRFARYIVENLRYQDVADLRKENLVEYAAALVAAGSKSETPRRLAEFGAILLTVLDIAEPALGVKFNRDGIIQFLVDQQVQHDANTDIGARAHASLQGFVNANIANFITDGDNVWSKSIPCYGRVETKNGVLEVSIETSEFDTIIRKLGYSNPNLIVKKLKAKGLMSYEAGKNYRKRTLIKDVGEVHTYVILFP